jgi:hypothetical protein
LGNFIFDQGHHEDTRQGLVIRVVLQQKQSIAPNSSDAGDENAQSQSTLKKVTVDRIELIPIIIERCVPRKADKKETERILRKIGVAEDKMTLAKPAYSH